MRRITLRMLVATITFLIGVAVTSVWLISGVSEHEVPPCRACAEIYASSEIPTVSLCEVIDNPERFQNQIVRIRAEFIHDAGYIFLSYRSCGNGNHVPAGFTESSGSCVGNRKLLSRYSGFESWYDSSADVVVVGRFGRIEFEKNFSHGRDGFNIMCLEQVSVREMSATNRVFFEVFSRAYFTLGKVGDFIFGRI